MNWDEEKKKFLIRHYGKLPPEDIAKQLKTSKMSVQTKASRLNLTNGRNKRRRDEDFGIGREYEPVERTRLVLERELDRPRNYLCPHYEKCLDYAADMKWRSWSCEECRYKDEHIKRSDYEVQSN